MSSLIQSQPVEYEKPASGGSGRLAGHWFAGTLAVAILGLFMGFIFNRYLTMHEGWFSYYALLMHKGQMPYRDFWFFAQPVSLFIAYVFGGDHLINLRIFGLVERIVLSGMLYYLLSRQFSPKASFFSTIVTMMVFLSYLTEGFFTYLVDSFAFLVAGLICVYEAQTRLRHERWFLALAGVFGSLCFFSKQSTGLFGTLALAFLIAWPDFRTRRFIPKLVWFSAGWCVAAAPIVAWLAVNGAWQAYLTQVFKGAVASKGSLRTILYLTLRRTFAPKDVVAFVLLCALAALALRTRQIIFRKDPDENAATKINVALVALLALAAAFVPVIFRVDEGSVVFMRRYIFTASKVLFIGMVLQFAWLLVSRLRSRPPSIKPVTAILIVAGFCWAYGAQLSFRVEQHAIVLGLAWLVAFAWDNVSARRPKILIGVLSVLCLLQIAESALYKYNDAYDWTGWRSVISLHSTEKSHWPQLAGFRMDEPTRFFLDSIIDDIARASKPGDQIFTFPTIPMFNFVTGHLQPTYAPVHLWDVCPDDVAEADAARVRAARPAVIVDLNMSQFLWEDGEFGFRQGRPSGQRKIAAVIKEFAASGDYRLMESFLTPIIQNRVDVWQRVR